MPSQKFGVDRPQRANAFAPASHTVPRPTAETIPAGMPIRSAIAIAMTASSIVTGSFWTMSSSTGCCVRTDSPRSPRSTPPSQ